MNNDITINNHRIANAISTISKICEMLDSASGHYRPTLNGDRYISDKELAEFLKLNKRSLVEYRKKGIIPYFHIGGRILYRESDIERIMQENYYDAYTYRRK